MGYKCEFIYYQHYEKLVKANIFFQNAVGQSYIGGFDPENDDWNNAPDNNDVWEEKKRDENFNFTPRNDDNRPSRGIFNSKKYE